MSGGTTSRACRSSVVSNFIDVTRAGSKGRVLHLMKESARPVPKQKKRRKIAALVIPGGSQSAAGM